MPPVLHSFTSKGASFALFVCFRHHPRMSAAFTVKRSVPGSLRSWMSCWRQTRASFRWLPRLLPVTSHLLRSVRNHRKPKEDKKMCRLVQADLGSAIYDRHRVLQACGAVAEVGNDVSRPLPLWALSERGGGAGRRCVQVSLGREQLGSHKCICWVHLYRESARAAEDSP